MVPMIARHQRDPSLRHQAFGGRFAPHRLDRGGWGANEDQSGCGAGTGKLGVLGQKSIARMDGLRPAGPCDGEDPVDIQVGLARRGGSDWPRFVAGFHMGGLGIGF